MSGRVLVRALVGIAVSAVACLVVAQGADVPAAVDRVLAVDPRWLLLPVLVVGVELWIRAVRWALLLTAVGPVALGPRRVVGPLAAGYLANAVLPARLGEVVRIVLVSTPHGNAGDGRHRVGGPGAGHRPARDPGDRDVRLGVIGATGWLPFVAMLGLLVVLGAGPACLELGREPRPDAPAGSRPGRGAASRAGVRWGAAARRGPRLAAQPARVVVRRRRGLAVRPGARDPGRPGSGRPHRGGSGGRCGRPGRGGLPRDLRARRGDDGRRSPASRPARRSRSRCWPTLSPSCRSRSPGSWPSSR